MCERKEHANVPRANARKGTIRAHNTGRFDRYLSGHGKVIIYPESYWRAGRGSFAIGKRIAAGRRAGAHRRPGVQQAATDLVVDVTSIRRRSEGGWGLMGGLVGEHFFEVHGFCGEEEDGGGHVLHVGAEVLVVGGEVVGFVGGGHAHEDEVGVE